MHFNKSSNSGSSQSLLTTASSSSPLRSSSPLSSSSSASSASSSSSSPKASHGLRLGLWCFLLVAVVLMAQQQPCEGRYLPTRSHGDDLDKLRELMLQILESSNEDQRPANEATGNAMSAQRANWLNKLGGGGPMEGMDGRKYGRYY